jgi:hypothetical protein
MRRFLVISIMTLLATGCGKKTSEPQYKTRAEMLDPQTCEECHSSHYEEWSGSMHAYASEDPVFRAMNARGQRETDGQLGDFCVNCHAPMAVREGATTDGLNLDEVPDELQGVTCYFCHSVEAVEGTHNNPLSIADDLVMRGGIDDPVPNDAHRSDYSALLDRNDLESATMCGSCHDIVTPEDAHIERTFAEWKGTLFADEEGDEPLSCGNCHMAGRDDVAADYDGVFLRRVHDHTMPGVDVAITEFPHRETQREMVQQELDSSVLPELCVFPDMGRATVSLENISAGHSFPSGAAQDRRVWVELVGYFDDEVVFESGTVPDGESLADHAEQDDQLWQLGDRIYDSEGNETHSFWEAADYESALLPGPVARSPTDPDYVDPHVTHEYTIPPVDRVAIRMRVRPMGLDVLRDFVDSGDLAPKFVDAIPTFSLAATEIEWSADDGVDCVPQ